MPAAAVLVILTELTRACAFCVCAELVHQFAEFSDVLALHAGLPSADSFPLLSIQASTVASGMSEPVTLDISGTLVSFLRTAFGNKRCLCACPGQHVIMPLFTGARCTAVHVPLRPSTSP